MVPFLIVAARSDSIAELSPCRPGSLLRREQRPPRTWHNPAEG